MADSLGFFVELDSPGGIGSFGWYIAAEGVVYDDYYLHDDGVVYDTCAPRFDAAGKQLSTGWFIDEMTAVLHGNKYYNKHGLIYPYANSIPAAVPATNNIESKVMEFE